MVKIADKLSNNKGLV